MVERLCTVRPTRFAAFPYIWKEFRQEIGFKLEKYQDKPKEDTFLKGSRKNSATAPKNGKKLIRKDSFMGNILSKISGRFNSSGSLKDLGLDRASSIIYGGAKIDKQTKVFFDNLGILIGSAYGLNETTGMILLYLANYDTDGLPMLSVKLNLNEDGELWVWSRGVMMGYLNQEEKTRSATKSDGYVCTSDIAVQDLANESYSILGRREDFAPINSNDWISVLEMENALKNTISCLCEVIIFKEEGRFYSFMTLKTARSENESKKTVENFFKDLALAKATEKLNKKKQEPRQK